MKLQRNTNKDLTKIRIFLFEIKKEDKTFYAKRFRKKPQNNMI
jgi:hypothetical protein